MGSSAAGPGGLSGRKGKGDVIAAWNLLFGGVAMETGRLGRVKIANPRGCAFQELESLKRKKPWSCFSRGQRPPGGGREGPRRFRLPVSPQPRELCPQAGRGEPWPDRAVWKSQAPGHLGRGQGTISLGLVRLGFLPPLPSRQEETEGLPPRPGPRPPPPRGREAPSP